jgi:trimeric autotransporter adhesin
LPTETDEDGEFTFTVQTANNDEGTIAVTATYNSAGASTAAADKKSATKLTTVTAPVVMTAQTVTVVASAASVEAGRNADVTITVTDTAGNAHAYKSVVVYSTGAGYLSAQTVTTDGEGKAVVKLITAANDSGTATITASVDGKSGTATVTVAAPVVVVAPTVEAVIGTFQGRWAVRVENATVGDRITIRVGGNWYQFNYSSETGSQLFSRKSTVGAIVDVTVWVNGSQKNVGLVTIK